MTEMAGKRARLGQRVPGEAERGQVARQGQGPGTGPVTKRIGLCVPVERAEPGVAVGLMLGALVVIANDGCLGA